MEQDISDLGTLVLAVGGAVISGTLLAGLMAGIYSYKDARGEYASLDAVRQQKLGRPKFLTFLAIGVIDVPSCIVNSDYHVNSLGHKYLVARLDKEHEEKQLEQERRYVFRK